MRTLDEPVDAFGQEVTEVVDTVTWTGGEIGAGEFDTFSLSVGPLPEDVDELAFPAIQTYSSGEEVAWIEPTPEGGEEPERPAPVLRAGRRIRGRWAHRRRGDDDRPPRRPRTTRPPAPSRRERTTTVRTPWPSPRSSWALIAVLLAGGAFVTARRRTP